MLNQVFMFLVSFIITGLTILVFWKVLLKDIYYKLMLVHRGILTTAEIIYLIDSLMKVQYRPMYYVKFKFQSTSGDIITEPVRFLFSKNDVLRYHVGINIKIKYDPKNLQNIKIMDELV